MINRRDLVVGGACLAAAASAEAMRPRERIELLGDRQLEDAIPRSFGAWKVREGDGIVTPESENSLAAKLYNQTVGRMYTGPDDSIVMLLLAYGNTQSDTLQLHRPEICYPAFGFEVTASKPTRFIMAGGADIPGRNLTALSPGRQERISYWTRIGEFLPVDDNEQRQMRFRTALAGIIPDGVLVRISSTMADEAEAFRLNDRFAADLLQAVPPAVRPALITTAKARQVAAGSARG